ncbi:C45 family peptidase [Acidobacteria bacterium AH-259-G07]|nr:C45 family peptidase [Acidobacteria bacterium AH-259-G07]
MYARNKESVQAKGISRRDFGRLWALGGSAVLLGRDLFASPGKMLRLETHGSPFSRGKQQGEACRDLFYPWMERYLRKRAEGHELSSRAELVRRFKKDLEQWQRDMEAVYPEGFEECRGIAAGLGVDEPTYFAAHFFDWPVRSCTVVGFRDAKGRPLVSKTDDIREWELGMNIMETTRPEQGHRHVHFHFAGTIWTVAGINEHGLAMGMNGINGPVANQRGMHSLDGLHTILPNCATVNEAIEHIRRLPINAGGFSLLLGDADGVLSLVEKTAAGTAVLPEKEGSALVHTNEILDAEFARTNPQAREPIRTNSRRRYDNALRLTRAEKKINEIMTDRSPQGAICQRGEQGMYTDFAAVFSPVEKKFRLWIGYPKVRVETLHLKTLLS